MRVVLADDQPIVRQGIAMLLAAQPDIEVVGQAADGRSVVALCRQLRPDVVVMDLQMPGTDGIEATRLLTQEHEDDPDTLVKVLALTTFDDDERVYGVLRAGASGFLLKQSAPGELVAALRRVAEGDAWIDPAVAPAVLKALASAPAPGGEQEGALDVLTPREREVLIAMAHGMSNLDIATDFFLSEATVKTHVARILMKTGSRDRTQAVVAAYQGGLVVPGEPRPRPR